MPHGNVTHYIFKNSKVYPGTIRHYSIYIPAQYDKTKPAALMVFQDGHTYLKADGDQRVPVVFDNLIHAKEMPVTIGVFIDPGFKKDTLPDKRGWQPTPKNRSVEYDSLGDSYSRFLLTEIMPIVNKKYNITKDPELRAIAGISSGAICAFTVAWERPDQFHKVLSQIGSFTDIRGGHQYPDIIRAAKNKPIRIFMQEGSQDNRSTKLNWNWFIGNLKMVIALEQSNMTINLF